MLTPDEIEWLGQKFNKIDKRLEEIGNTLKHINEKAHRIVEVDKCMFQWRLDLLKYVCEAKKYMEAANARQSDTSQEGKKKTISW